MLVQVCEQFEAVASEVIKMARDAAAPAPAGTDDVDELPQALRGIGRWVECNRVRQVCMRHHCYKVATKVFSVLLSDSCVGFKAFQKEKQTVATVLCKLAVSCCSTSLPWHSQAADLHILSSSTQPLHSHTHALHLFPGTSWR